MTQEIDLFFWPTPNGWKISIALEEMGLPYRPLLIDIGVGDQFDPEFLTIAPNNRMPAIIDPDGPDGAPVSVFESGSILQYLSAKTGRFGGQTPRERIAVTEWLMWQMGGLGPMAGQAHHFLKHARLDVPYAKDRYRAETARLYAVLDRRLAGCEFVAGDDFTIADIAVWPWASLWEGQQQTLTDKPHMARWLDQVSARPGVKKGRALAAELRDATGDKSALKRQFREQHPDPRH
jgi:GSH-dependent disulfide-bond oxidoreductase